MTKWGMSAEQVKATETGQPDTLPSPYPRMTGLGYSGIEINGQRATVSYAFIDNRLVRASYTFQAIYTNLNQYVAQFDAIEQSLIDKYGKPLKTTLVPGSITRYSIWDASPTTRMSHVLSIDEKTPEHEVNYMSIELRQIEVEAGKEHSNKQL